MHHPLLYLPSEACQHYEPGEGSCVDRGHCLGAGIQTHVRETCGANAAREGAQEQQGFLGEALFAGETV